MERVRLTDDFLRIRTEAQNAEQKPLDTLEPDASPDAELRLYYVAAARAQVELDVPAPLADKLAHLCARPASPRRARSPQPSQRPPRKPRSC